MAALKLSYPVYTMDQQLLLPAGTVLSTETLEGLISAGRAASHQTYPLLSHGTVKKDLLRQMKRSPYDVIFSRQEEIAEVMTMLETVHLVLPVLQTLDYFKKDDYRTYCHVLVVFALSALIARDILPDYGQSINEVSIGPTHDIGKICVPLRILRKQTPLTKAERNLLDAHSATGYVLLSYYHRDHGNLAAIVARDHHERKDGSGIPRGIELTNPLVEIIVVCDVYDALISPRPYRAETYDNRTALEEITNMAETNKIGWQAVRSLVALNRKDRTRYKDTEISAEKRGTPPAPNFYGVVLDEEDGDS